jgi:hypothetical protein
MLHPIAFAGIVAIVVVGVALLALRTVGRRKDDEPKMATDQTAMWLTGTSAEEHRDYLRERAKNDRHQDLD